VNISSLILTLNEEVNLPDCLKSLAWCDDIVVLDSFSEDNTKNIAEDSGARFIQRKFDDYANQRNYGLDEIGYKHQWVLMIDADERTPPELVDEIRSAIENVNKETSLFRLRIKYYFMGRWIRYSSGYPTWYGRLIRQGDVRVERLINEHCQTDGGIGYLKNHLIHYPFNKGFGHWVEKHNRYSTMEAEFVANKQSNNVTLKNMLCKDPVLRRKVFKEIVYSLPFRPVVVFFGLYFLKRGILDGRAGLTYCTLRAFYEYMIDCKIREIKRRKDNLPI